MKKNYFKCYFQAFGYIANILVIALFAVMGIALYQWNFLNESYSAILNGALVLLSLGAACVGVTGIKHDKVGMTDFIRVTFFVASIILGILAILTGKHMGAAICYFASTAIFLAEIIVRCFMITRDATGVGMKAYFGALAFRFNPLILVAAGMILSIVVGILNFANVKETWAFLSDSNLKFYVIGGGIALLLILLVFAMEDESDASFLDAILAVVFISALFAPALLATEFTATEIKYDILLLGVSGAAILFRAVFYNKDVVYDNNMHKTNTYFKNIFGKYSMLLAFVVGILVVACFMIAVAYANGSCNLYTKFAKYIPFPFADNVTVLVFTIAPLAILTVLMALVFVFRGFSSTEPVKTDWLLVAIIFSTALSIPAFVVYGVQNNFPLLTNNILLLVFTIVCAVFFVVSVILQIVRIMNFDPMASIIAAEASQRMNEKKEAKKAEAEAKAEAEREAKEKEPYDPFALTEEDEAIYEAEYGAEEKKEEETPAEEPAVNPYAEEEPAEEEAVEEVVEEEAPAEEEVVEEEAPAEEETEAQADDFDAFLESVPEKQEKPAEEPASEEEAEEDEAEEEEEEDEVEDEAEDEAEEEAPAEPVEKAKEANIEVTEYIAVDEDGQPKKIKRKFSTKMMFAPYETKEYYNQIKNYLMMYRAKGRSSARCESFRYKGLVAKLALGGKAVKVFLALDPALIAEYPKYHLKDVSEKKQYAEVPVMIKVRSDRGLKYCQELIDLMFANRLVKPKRNFEPTNYIPQMIPNGEAILGNLGMSTYYLQNTMNVNGIPEEMPDDLIEYLPQIPGDELPEGEEEVEAVAYLDTLCAHFEEGDEITLDVLKSMHICQKGNILRIKARGTLDRKLIIYAEKFDDDALKMLMCTNGTAVHIVR